MGSMRALLCGYYGKGNGGDEALLASLLQMLPREVTPLVLSGNPVQTEERYGVESCDRMSFFAVIQAMRHADVFIWGGGSLLQDTTGLMSPLYYGGLMGLAQRLGLKTIAWAQGIGPLNHPLSQKIARKAFAGCTAVSVRDRAAANLLTDWHISSTLAPDPVWALAAQPVDRLKDLPTPRVAVTLRSHPQLTPTRLAILTQALVNFQQATQTCILLIPFQPSYDLAIAQSLQSHLGDVAHLILIEDPRELKGLFQGVEMAIGMRLHSLIMAASQKCRCFGISYDPKVTNLLNELELPGWEISQLPEDPDFISRTWIEHYTYTPPISEAKIQSLVNQALIHQEILTEVFPVNSK